MYIGKSIKQRKLTTVRIHLFISTIILALITLFDLRMEYEFMLIYSIYAAVIFALLIYFEVKYFEGLNFNLLLLVGYTFRVVQPAITKSFNAINGIDTYNLIPENVTTDYMFPTAVWMNIYYMIFYLCVLHFSKSVYLENALKLLFRRFNVVYFAIPAYIIGIAYNITISFIPAGIIPGIFTTIFGNLVMLSIMMMLFDSLFSQKKWKQRLFSIMIIGAMFQATFWGFMKGPIMNYFVFYLLYYFLDRKYSGQALITKRFIWLIGSMFAIIYLLVYPFMQTKRVVSGWGPEVGYVAVNKYSNIEILSDVLHGKIKHESNESGSRFDAIDANAFFYKDCCRYNWRTTELLISNLELLVPRFINPNKHNAEAGLMVSGYVLQGSFGYKDTIGTSNYVGQFASAYLIGGPLMVFLLAFLNGWFVTFYYNFLVRHYFNIIALILTMKFLFEALLCFEEIHDGGALFVGVNTAMMLVVLFTSKIKFLNFRH